MDVIQINLIDKDALFKNIKQTIDYSIYTNHEDEIMDAIRYAPAVDAVPVICCKDCKYIDFNDIQGTYCKRNKFEISNSNDFRSYGIKGDIK